MCQARSAKCSTRSSSVVHKRNASTILRYKAAAIRKHRGNTPVPTDSRVFRDGEHAYVWPYPGGGSSSHLATSSIGTSYRAPAAAEDPRIEEDDANARHPSSVESGGPRNADSADVQPHPAVTIRVPERCETGIPASSPMARHPLLPKRSNPCRLSPQRREDVRRGDPLLLLTTRSPILSACDTCPSRRDPNSRARQRAVA